jgi:hypothetical protein
MKESVLFSVQMVLGGRTETVAVDGKARHALANVYACCVQPTGRARGVWTWEKARDGGEGRGIWSE